MKLTKTLLFMSLFILMFGLTSRAADENDGNAVELKLTADVLANNLKDDETFKTYLGSLLGDKTDVNLQVTAEEGQALTEDQIRRIGQGIKNFAAVTGIDFSSITSLTTFPASTFNGDAYLETIKLPKLTSLSQNLFTDCKKLKTLVIGEWENKEGNTGLEMANIPSGCFQNCSDLTNLYIIGVEHVDGYAFQGCTSIKTLPIALKEGAKVEFGGNAFSNMGFDGELTIPENVIKIGDYCFGTNKWLTTINLPSTLQEVDKSFVNTCTSLKAINIATDGDNYLTIDGVLYKKNADNTLTLVRCPMVKESPVNVPADKQVTEIGENAFYECTTKEINLPEGLTKIGKNAFTLCGELTSLTIPSTVTDMDASCINECPNLAIFKMASDNDQYLTTNNVTLSKQEDGKYYIFRVPEGAELGTELDLTNMEHASEITGVGSNAFHKVNHEQKANGLKSLKLPDTVENLKDECFKGSSIEEFYIPENLTEAGFGAAPFSECNNLTTFSPIGHKTKEFYVDQYGILYNDDYNKLFKVPNNYQLQYKADEGIFDVLYFVKAIQTCAFEGTKNIKEVRIAQGIKKVPHRCFYNSTVETALIPNSVTEIGQDAFMGSAVKNVVMLTTTQKAPHNQNAPVSYNSFYGVNGEFQMHLSKDYGNFVNQWVDESIAAAKGSTRASNYLDDDSYNYGWAGLAANGKLKEDVAHRAIFENSGNITHFYESEGENTILNELDANNTLTENHYDYITLYRDFSQMKDDEYASLALPVDVTKATLEDAFGKETKIWKFVGRKNNVLRFEPVEWTSDDFANTDVILHKGIGVLIRPEYKMSSYLLKMNEGQAAGSTVANTDIIGSDKPISYDANEKEQDNIESGKLQKTEHNYNYVNGETKTDETFLYGFYATYQPKADMPRHAYYMKSDGTFYFTKNSLKMSKALRGFIYGNGESEEGTGNAKAMPYFMDTITGIDGIEIEPAATQPMGDIYNISGQLVRKNATSTEGLPKGIYIINGKKVAL